MAEKDSAPTANRRLISIHAHPDDESLNNGITLPKYAAEGAHTTLVTCTLGEEGEIVVPDLELLSVHHADQLGGYRTGELAKACTALGVTEHHYLGGIGRYRDSGMMGEPTNSDPRSFWQANLDEAASYLVPIIRRNRPQVMLAYNDFGGYGHPDHIKAHRVALRARELAADSAYRREMGTPWQIAKVYFAGLPRTVLAERIAVLAKAGVPDAFGVSDAGDAPFAVDDKRITTVMEGVEYVDARLAAMRAHRSQLPADEPEFLLYDVLGPQAIDRDYFELAIGVPGGADRPESDLFAGLD
ncbi:N-acetyl-1-D-myo-inositol-2-amino-2-deoxy-alpha-D-glucopyranoside deacetylase [Antricoccus suffuscus]|uniref:1D-myo-inositol 2-acetamido-2-deoxy-alpha-D-glucopyranoside deacetylase n=1 Tax=Antricoccus suffuscus TaxID=1629062 RepID=A0A2T1A5K7_9ACTN|nr:N-acetyl-1-D-myo-inositol-2-amino-2-deoxy-alpha-D-glucopyranoside deacetylase [Antricoccus suffuscus]PRZ43892.1 N-acetyl-1-D-myo-inositol-2-amino-2-deoxy-alpha-D-glucopyranoside deacetylase [Antricoccus suffuscus]